MKTSHLILAAALASAPLSAIAGPWAIDKGHASINFSVDHFGFSDVHGQFREFDAQIDFDPENIDATSASFTINAASFDTNLAARDDHVKSADFLNVDEYPSITFTTTKVTQTGDETADIEGEMTIRGVTKPVTFKAELNQLGASPFDPSLEVAGFTISGEIDRTEFGIDTYAPAIGATLPVVINFEMSPSDADNT